MKRAMILTSALAGVFLCNTVFAQAPAAISSAVSTTSDAPPAPECREAEFTGNPVGLFQCRAEGWRDIAVAEHSAAAACYDYVGVNCRPAVGSDAATRFAKRLPSPAKVAKAAPAKTAARPVARPAPQGASAEDLTRLQGQVAAIDARIVVLEARETLTSSEHQLLRDLRALRDEVVAARGEAPNLTERLARVDARMDRVEDRVDLHDRRIRDLGERRNALRVGGALNVMGTGDANAAAEFTPTLGLTAHWSVGLSVGLGGGFDSPPDSRSGLVVSAALGPEYETDLGEAVSVQVGFGLHYLRLVNAARAGRYDSVGGFAEPALLLGERRGVRFRLGARVFVGDMRDGGLNALRVGGAALAGVALDL